MEGFYGCEKVEKMFRICDIIHIWKTVNLKQFKGMQSSKLGMQMEFHLPMKGMWKGYIFWQKMK